MASCRIALVPRTTKAIRSRCGRHGTHTNHLALFALLLLDLARKLGYASLHLLFLLLELKFAQPDFVQLLTQPRAISERRDG